MQWWNKKESIINQKIFPNGIFKKIKRHLTFIIWSKLFSPGLYPTVALRSDALNVFLTFSPTSAGGEMGHQTLWQV